METAQLVSHPFDRVTRLVWGPVRRAAQLLRQAQEALQQVVHQVQEFAQLMLRALDGATLQATRMRTRSQVEFMFGPLTFSVASGVIYARAAGGRPEWGDA